MKVFERRIRERFFACIEALEAADMRRDVEVALDAPADGSTLPPDESGVVVPGFAIVGLCCLLIETLASFSEVNETPVQEPIGACTYPTGSCIRPQERSGKRIREFLKRPSFGDAFTNNRVGHSFVHGIRSGIFHDAETRHWVIWRDEPPNSIVGALAEQHILNRTAFCQALRDEFGQYLAALRDPGNPALRRRFVEKMNAIVASV
jgi:hypothetical protein